MKLAKLVKLSLFLKPDIKKQFAVPHNRTLKKNQGFSVIEMVIVVGLSSLLMISVSTVLITFITTNTRLKLDQKMRTDGHLVLNNIEAVARNADFVSSTCNGTVQNVLELQNGSQTINFTLTNDRILLNETGSTAYLTSDEYKTETLEFICYQGMNQQQYVKIAFRLKKGEGSATDKDTLIQSFMTGVTIRNSF